MAPTTIRTPAGRVAVDIPPIKGSRFTATVAPATDEEAALAVVASVRDADPDASHHCWAFRLAGGRARSSDDGEPGGTAGPPILRRIEGADLHDAVVVVTRWFGGTKLGTGGLVRAYGTAAAAGLEAVAVHERPVLARLALTHPYALTGPVEGVLHAHEATVLDSTFGADVDLVVAVPVASAEAFTDAVVEATAGAVTPTPA